MSSIKTISGINLEYDTFGDIKNPPILLIQGLGAQMIGWPTAFCEKLSSAGFYVICFDNRDVGLSQKFPGSDYELVDMAHDSAELLISLDIPKAHVVGQSMGGMIAQHMVALYPEKVTSLTLIYTCAKNKFIQGGDILAEREKVPLAQNRDEAARMYVVAEEPCGSPGYPTDTDHLLSVGGRMWDRCYYPEGAVRQRAAIYRDTERHQNLNKIECPVLILHGQSDSLISSEGSVEIHNVLPHSKLKIYEGMGHQLPMQLWEDMVRRIKENSSKICP